MNGLTSTACSNSKVPIIIAREVCHGEARDLCQGRRLMPKAGHKIINRLLRPLHFDGHPGWRIADFAR